MPFRLYLIGFATAILTSLAFEISKETVVRFGNWPPQSAGVWALIQAVPDNWQILLIATVLAVGSAILFLLAVYRFDTWLGRRSFRKFDFFLNSLNELNEAGYVLERDVKDKIETVKSRTIRAAHEEPYVRKAFEDALKKLLRIIPPEYQGKPSVRTGSVMLRKSYLDGRLTRKAFGTLTPLNDDALEVVHYVDHLGLKPVLHEDFRPLKFSHPKADEVFSLATIRAGNIRMGPTKRGVKLGLRRPFVRWETPFIQVGKVDREKRSIINIPLTNQMHEMIGVISLDSSQLQFTGPIESVVYLKNILANFIDNVEKTLIIIANQESNSEHKPNISHEGEGAKVTDGSERSVA